MHKLDLVEDQYDRQKKITWWDQETLKNSKILIIGAGALGNEISKNLSLVGIGKITIIDNDIVDLTNISRCVFFDENDIGLPKSKLLSERINSFRNINSNYFVSKVQDLGIGIFQDYDVVIGALDNREARSWVNEYTRMFSIPWIDGAIEGLNGLVRSFGTKGVCYECTLSEEDLKLLAIRKSCALLSEDEITLGKVPTTATSSSIISGFQVQEALLYLSKQSESFMPNLGKQMTFFGETMTFVQTNLREKSDCYVDHNSINYQKIDISYNKKIKDIIAEGALSENSYMFRDIITSLDCLKCGSSKNLNIYITHAKQKDVICNKCNTEMKINSDRKISNFENKTFAELSIPNLELLTSDEKYIIINNEKSRK